MRNRLVTATLAALVLGGAAAFAATDTVGKVKTFDATTMTLTLDNGTTYYLPDGFKDPGLKAGEKVTVSWNMINDRHEVETVTIQN